MDIKEVIVVEGKNDTLNIQRVLNADTIETHGTHLSKETLNLIKTLQNNRGIIVFTDPDAPGDQIRTKINAAVPGCKNAFLESRKAKGKGKVGIEHASPQDIIDALHHCITYESKSETLSWDEFNELGLQGKPNSAFLRNKVSRYFHLGEANAKTCFKRLNMLQVTIEEINEVLRNENE